MLGIAWEEIYCRECCGNAKRSRDEIRGLTAHLRKFQRVLRYDNNIRFRGKQSTGPYSELVLTRFRYSLRIFIHYLYIPYVEFE